MFNPTFTQDLATKFRPRVGFNLKFLYKVNFVLYGTNITLPILGKAMVVLQCEAGKQIKTMVYVVKGQAESLLGKQDGVRDDKYSA